MERRFSSYVPADIDDQGVRKLLAGLGGRAGIGIRKLGGRRDLVRNAHGQPLPCCWRDCWDRGSTRHTVVAPHDAEGREGDTLTYIFCGPAHKAMWLGTARPEASALGLILP
jgi:hypothetical protein